MASQVIDDTKLKAAIVKSSTERLQAELKFAFPVFNQTDIESLSREKLIEIVFDTRIFVGSVNAIKHAVDEPSIVERVIKLIKAKLQSHVLQLLLQTYLSLM